VEDSAVLPYAALTVGTISTILGAVNLGSIWSASDITRGQRVGAGAVSVGLIGMGVVLGALGARELRYVDEPLPELED